MYKSFQLLTALFLMAAQADAQTPNDWQTIHVPGSWQANGPIEAKDYHGVAWYRTWVKPHDSFFQSHERHLLEESALNVRDLANAHEVFVNGKKIGTGGEFPPNFRSGKSELHRHKIPVGTWRKGEWNEIAIRVYNESGPGGFLGEAPFVMNYSYECVLDGTWEFRVGDGYTPGGALTNKPATSAFSEFHESNRVLGRSVEFVTGDRLSPEESYRKMKTSDGLAVDLLLHEPEVAQPTHFSFDERGRLWIAQYRQYPYPAGIKMLSRDKFYRAVYDKVPPAPPNHDRGADIISIHESTKHDGVYDKSKVFLDGLNMANAVVRGRGGVWVMHTPYLLFYPDKNFDDIPDGPPSVQLAGFGLEDTHSVANGLVWGPDGWLYGCQGSTTSSRITRPGLDPTNAPGVYFESAMVWRYHPETRVYEIFAEGSGNAFGLDFDSEGHLYSGHNGGETRGWNYVQGGYFPKSGAEIGKYGPPRNPYSFGVLPWMKSENVVTRFSHFGAYAEGTAIPAPYFGTLFAVDPLHNVVVSAQRRHEGATFSTKDIANALSSTDPAFRPVYAASAPDGSMFIGDLYEYYIAHGQHYQSQIDPTTGRIYRIRGTEKPLETDYNLADKTTDQLIALLSHPNKWHRATAVRLLGERKDRKATSKLKKLIEKDNGLGALNALWALYQSAGLDEKTALKALQHPYAPVRRWTVRLLGDDWGINRGMGAGEYARERSAGLQPAVSPIFNRQRLNRATTSGLKTRDTADSKSALRSSLQPGQIPGKLFQAILAQAKVETDPENLAQIACTARRLNSSQALPLVSAVLGHDECVSDAYIPLLSWWVLEAHIPAANEEVFSMLKTPGFWDRPMVFEHILPRLARRYAVEEKRQDLLFCARLFRAAPSSKHAAQLMKGFEEAFRGRSMTGLPDELVNAIAVTGQAPLSFRVRQGDAAALKEAIALIQDAKAKFQDRLLFTRTFGEVRVPDSVPALLTVASSSATNELRKAAFTSLATYDQENLAEKTIELVPRLTNDVRTAAFTLLTSRAKWSLKMLQAMQDGKIQPSLLPVEFADRLRASKDKSISELAGKLFPKQPAGVAAEFQKRITEVQDILNRGTGNPYAGEATFMQRCASCHTLFFKGGHVGPELTKYQRDNLSTMLLSIVNPNAEIREGFQAYTIETTDDRSLTGFIADRDNQVLVLRGVSGENVTLRTSEIKELQPMTRSLMPEGLLDGLSDQQLRDFFAYLRLSQPIGR